MFVESSNPARNGDQARLLSPLYPADMGNMCFEFWYHLLGPADPGRKLSLFDLVLSQPASNLRPLLARQQNTIWKAFHWRADSGPILHASWDLSFGRY